MADDNTQDAIESGGRDIVDYLQAAYAHQEKLAAQEAWKVPSQTEPPLSPHDVLNDLPKLYRQRVDEKVREINRHLREKMRDFQTRGHVEVGFVFALQEDRHIIEDAMQRFVDAEWQVEELGYGYFPDTPFLFGYRFKLPGKILTDRDPSADPAV